MNEKQTSGIKAVIFDMDGVLLDTETISWRNWEDAAKEFGISNISEANSKCMGANRADTITILKQLYGSNFDGLAFLNRTSELFDITEKTEGIPLMPYVTETLDYLKEKYTLSLASSTRKVRVHRQLADCKIIQYFKTIICGDQVEHSKPDPEIYLKACQSIGLKPEECAAVEDSFNGVRSAHAAGLFTIMVPDKMQPDETIRPLCNKIIPSLKHIQEIL